MKRRITNISAMGIIFPLADPRHIFIEIKDRGHPIRMVHGQLCPIGGNWIGENARKDRGTQDTFFRELEEELSFDRPMVSTLELAQLGVADAGWTPAQSLSISPSESDVESLNWLKKRIKESATPFGSHLNEVLKSALDAADPANKREGFTTLSCYWVIGLEQTEWRTLESLQRIFGNLSNESVTLLTSLDEIIQTNTRTAFCHDGALKRFFLSHGQVRANELPHVQGCESEYAGEILPTYSDYLERYDIAKKP